MGGNPMVTDIAVLQRTGFSVLSSLEIEFHSAIELIEFNVRTH